MCWFRQGFDDCGPQDSFMFVDALGLLPYDWRNHLADRLLALQVSDPPGAFRWTAPDGDDVRASALAILALRLVAAE